MKHTAEQNVNRLKRFLNQRFDQTTQHAYAYLSTPTLIDRIFQYTFLQFVPYGVVPNYLTILRYLLIPTVLALLIIGETQTGFLLFVVAAMTDALDGALARVRRQITDWGILHDPLADKLLIGSVAILVITRAFGPWMTIAIVGIEVILIATAYVRYQGEAIPARTVGKIKMVLQSVGVAAILCGEAFGLPGFLILAEFALYGAIGFAVLSLVVYRSI